jgi:hypothetical protein
MIKNYLNGCLQPKFIIISDVFPNPVIELNIDFQNYSETFEDSYIEHELLNGDIVDEFLYCHYYFSFDYSQWAAAPELLKWKALLNYLQLGYTVKFYPHKEIDRFFFVTTVKDKRTITRMPGYKRSQGHRDFKIDLRTKYPLTVPGSAVNWVSIADDDSILDSLVNEIDVFLDENGDAILDESGFPLLSKVV